MSYSAFWANDLGDFAGMTDPTGSDGNVHLDPRFLAFPTTLDFAEWRFYLHPTSQLTDAGDPTLLDPDGSRSDSGTDPFQPDTDGDGVNDYDELLASTDPRDDTSH